MRIDGNSPSYFSEWYDVKWNDRFLCSSQIQQILAPIQCRDVVVVGCSQLWLDRGTAIPDVETVYKLETTSWDFLAPSGLLIKSPGSKAGLTETLTTHVRAPELVWPEEWGSGHTGGENLHRGCQPLRSQRETSQMCLQMVMGWGGLHWGWKPPSGSLVLALCPVLWIPPCFMFQLAQLGGWWGAAAADLTTNLFSIRCLFLSLVYLKIHQKVSLFLSMPDAPRRIFIRKYEHKSRTLVYQLPWTANERNNLAAVCL